MGPGTNVHTGLKTTPYVTPPSRSGVVSQSRFWNAGVGNVTPQDPEQRMDYSNAVISESKNLAMLRDKAIKMEMQSQRDLINLQGQRRQDITDLQNQKMDYAEGDMIDQVSRGIVAYQGVGQVAHDLAKKVGLKDVAKLIDKLPLVGETKESKEATELYGKLEQAIKENNNQAAKMMIRQAEVIGDIYKIREQQALGSGDFGLEVSEVDKMIGPIREIGTVDDLWEETLSDPVVAKYLINAFVGFGK